MVGQRWFAPKCHTVSATSAGWRRHEGGWFFFLALLHRRHIWVGEATVENTWYTVMHTCWQCTVIPLISLQRCWRFTSNGLVLVTTRRYVLIHTAEAVSPYKVSLSTFSKLAKHLIYKFMIICIVYIGTLFVGTFS